ncbi:hypothetical protein AX14_009492 [Amanita brunnescens Koide BX004]|nr:hypothetical protein AX14_009492 [Amanita brunnescens Koide BX004]
MLTASQPVAMSESGSFFDSASGVDISGSELNSIGGNQYKNSTVVHGTNIYVQAEARQAERPSQNLENLYITERYAGGSPGWDTGPKCNNDAITVHNLPGSPTIERITKISVYCHEHFVQKLGVTYKLSNGKAFTSMHGDEWNGKRFYDWVDFVNLCESEIIVSVHGKHRSPLDSLGRGGINEIAFVILNTKTNSIRTAGPYGNYRGTRWFPTTYFGNDFQVSGPANILAFGSSQKKSILTDGCALAFIGVGSAPNITSV